MIVSHSHIDHIGYLPRLAKLGLKAPVHCTRPVHQLAELMLLDSARIQEEDAAYANKKGYSRHKKALPLYTTSDAKRALRLRKKQRMNQWFTLNTGGTFRARFLNAGHILGSAFIQLSIRRPQGEIKVVYSGDLGRFEVPLHLDPKPLPDCDVLIIESTYGDRKHTKRSVADQLKTPIRKTLRRGAQC